MTSTDATLYHRFAAALPAALLAAAALLLLPVPPLAALALEVRAVAALVFAALLFGGAMLGLADRLLPGARTRPGKDRRGNRGSRGTRKHGSRRRRQLWQDAPAAKARQQAPAVTATLADEVVADQVVAGQVVADQAKARAAAGASAPGLVGWLRARAGGDDVAGGDPAARLPRLRSADRHPDAPARAPLRAGIDLADAEPLPPPDAEAPRATPVALPVEAIADVPLLQDGPLPPAPVLPPAAQSAPDALPTLADRLAAALDQHGDAARARLIARGRGAAAPMPRPVIDESLDDALDAAIAALNR